MSEARFLPSGLVAAVADREGVPLQVAQDLAARAVVNAAVLSDRRGCDFPKRRRAESMTALLGQILEREDRES